MAIAEGANAPDFTLQSNDGPVSLKELRGTKVVLYFYPRDNTPGCTREACDFQDKNSKLAAAGAVVLGVSKDPLTSHAKFATKFGLTFALLTDPDSAVAKAYGAHGTKLMYGKPVVGTIRTTVLIGASGKVERVWSPVKVDGHADEVLAAVEGKAVEAKPARKAAVRKPAAQPRKSSKPAKRRAARG